MFLLFDDSFIAELGNNRGEKKKNTWKLSGTMLGYNKVTTVITLILL